MSRRRTEIQPVKVVQKERSWVYEFSEKLETADKTYFHCRYVFKNGKKCNYKIETKNGQTTGIAYHLKEKHSLKPSNKLVQATLTFENMPEDMRPKRKTFRQAFAELIAKQYLPYSLIEEKVLQDSYLAFYNEWVKTKNQPAFVTDKTVSADIGKMADTYIAEMKIRFKSKLSLCMDVWTGPNEMSFLGITFTYLDENFNIQRNASGIRNQMLVNSGFNLGVFS
jgi:hypothetical protein